MNNIPQHISDIIRAAQAAPSGDNSQPWQFVFAAPGTIEFYIIQGRDNVLLNVDDSGTLIASGAAVENAIIMAHSLGYEPKVEWNNEDSTLVATMRLGVVEQKASTTDKRLAQIIFKRHSNRKKYFDTSLKPDDKAALLSALKHSSEISAVFIEDKEPRHTFARNLTTMEEVALSNRKIHELFFKSISWSKSDNERGIPGLYIYTLELPAPVRALFKILRYWSVARVLARIGFPRVVAKGNAELDASASALVCITAKQFNRATFLEIGRVLERFWLTATDRDMAFQVVTGLLFLARRAQRENGTELFTNIQKLLIQKSYNEICNEISTKDTHPVLAFRVGYADKPTAYSHRIKPHIEVQNTK